MNKEELQQAIAKTQNKLNRILGNRNPPPYELADRTRKKLTKLNQELKELGIQSSDK